MSELGAMLCSDPDCRQHDFLPFTCSACGRVYCKAHMTLSGHKCDQGMAYLASRRDEGEGLASSAGARAPEPSFSPSLAKPSEVMSVVTSRFDGREGELNATATHFYIKASEGEANDGNAGAPDRLLKSSQQAVDKAVTEKGKRVSTQVHRMLLKAKAVGDKRLRMEDRFFLEVHYCGNDTDVHHLFFSRLWTVGRALDQILKTHRRHLRLKPGEEGNPLELARAGSPSGLPTGGILNDLSPEQLQSFDAVTVRPRVSLPATETIASSSGSGPTAATTVPGLTLGVACTKTVVARSSMEATDDSNASGGDGGISEVLSDGALTVGIKEANVDTGLECAVSAAVNSAGNEASMTITVGHGKVVYEVGGVIPDRESVLDIKRRLEPITGVPFSRQKLLFKGVLRDGDKICDTKIVEGAKVMLLGAAVAAKK